MPSFPLVQGFVESHLKRGISRKEAEEIVRFVADERADAGELTGTQREQLNRVIALYGDFFTPTAKRTFERLAESFETRRFAAGDTRGQTGELNSPVRMRAALLSEREQIDERFDLVKKGARPKVLIHELDFEELLAREPEPREGASLVHEEAFALKLHGDNLLAGLEFPESTAVQSVFAELEHLERTAGDNDGKLAPRDLKDVSPASAAVMDALYGDSGKRLLALSTIKKRLPAAIFEVINDKRNRDGLRALFTLVAEDAVNRIAADYARDVQAGGAPLTRFLEDRKLTTAAEKGDWTARMHELVAPPTLDEIEHLYAAATGGKLQVREFYNVARLDQRDLFQLQARLPERFPRPRALKASAALAAPKKTKLDVHALAAAWNREVTGGSSSVEDFARAHDVKLNVLNRARKEHPELFKPMRTREHNARIDGRLNAFVDALERAMDAAPFEKVRGLLKLVNADPVFRDAHDEVSYEDYYSFRRAAKERFSRVDASDRWMSAVEVTLREVMSRPGADALSRKDLVSELKKTWPKVSYSRLSHMLEWKPDLPIPGRRGKRSAAEIDKLADAILSLMKKEPGRSQASITRALKAAGQDVTQSLVNAVVRDYRPTLFAQFNRVQERRLIARRTSLPSRQLLSMCIRTSAPGTKASAILEKYNGLLEARGLPPHKASDAPRLRDLVEPYGMAGPNDHFAAVLFDVLTEYADAAPKGTSSDEVWAQVRRDYPDVSPHDIGRYRGRWRESGKKEDFAGKGKKNVPERYRSGWDMSRVLKSASGQERVELAKLTEALHIPFSLPLIDGVVDDLGDSQPLKNANVLWVTHLLSDIVAMANALQDAGLQRAQVVGTPYGSNGAVKDALEAMGMPVRVPELSVEDYRAKVEAALDDIVKLHKKNNKNILILDDGGLTSDILHTKDKYKDIRSRVRIVEQTTGGVLLAEKHALETPVGNVARSKSKKVEGAAIGEVVAGKLVQALARASEGHSLKGKSVVVVGYGFIGPHIAKELRAHGAKLTVLERNKARGDAAKAAGAKVVLGEGAARTRALQGADLVVGATGRRSITKEDLELLKDGARVASASSKRVELALDELTTRKVVPHENPLLTLPNAEYTLKSGNKIFAVGDGWPVNFDGGVQSVPPEKIQLTDAAMLATLFQVSNAQSPGLVALDNDVDERLLERYRDLQFGEREVYDPDRWINDLIQLAG